MNTSNRILLLFTLITASFTTAMALNIKGLVKDNTGEPLPQATMRLLSAKDSAFVTGTKTNASGIYRFSGIKSGNYLIEASYIGYATKFTPVTLSKSNITVGAINMSESSIMLKDVTVTAVKTQIKVMEDTVEFNADSYKTQPNAVVEDLLKRLPGVEVDSDGKITANGKTVSKILIDGKEFFSDDPKVASKNLPVNMVDKLQVVDRKSDLARLTGVDDGEDETVINLTVKKDMQDGYFGNIEAGYGTDERYTGSFNLNRFWNGNQVTLLGNFNNTNELGFTDSNGSRFRRFGGTNGINESQAIGLNFNVGKEEIFRVGGNVMYSHTDRDTRQRQSRQYLFTDSTSWAESMKDARDKGHNVRADFRIQWQPDSFNTLEFRPRISYNVNNSASIDSSLIMAGNPNRTHVTSTYNDNSSRGHSLEFGGNLIYSHNFKRKRGRSFSINLRYNHSNVREKENSYSRNLFYLFNDSLDLYDQFGDNHTWSNVAQARATWTEPIGNAANGHFLTFSYRIQYRWNNADKLVYDHPVHYPGELDDWSAWIDYSASELNDTLSNRFRNDFMTQEIRLGYKYVSRKHNLDLGLTLVPSSSKSENLMDNAKSIPLRKVWNFAPFLRYRYKISKTSSLNLFYHGHAAQPSMSQLQPVADMSDPMHVMIGNPNLDPSFNHGLRMRFQSFDQEHQRSIMMMGNFELTQNSIVSKTVFSPNTGSQITTYENVNGVWSGRLMMIYSQPLRNKAWQVSAHMFTNYNHTVGFNNGEKNISGTIRWNIMPSIAFRPDNMEFELRPRYSIQNTHNSLKSATGMTIHNFGGTFSAYYYTPIGIILNSDLTYTGTKGYAQGYDKNEWMWNASISYQLLRNRSLTLSVKAYDLLQQRSSISRTITANYIDDTSYNNLTRYFMFTVAYRFNTFGKGNQPADRNAWRGWGGPPPGGRPGGGRPR